MSFNRVVLALMAVVAAYWYLTSEPDPQSQKVDQQANQGRMQTPSSTSAKKQKPNLAPSLDSGPQQQKPGQNALSVAASEPQKAAPDQSIQEQRQLLWDKDWVEFEMVDGFAVAFGDVLLGTLKPEQKAKLNKGRGYFEPPKSRLWPSNEIPYAIDENLQNREAVESAVAYFNENTVIRLVPYGGEENVLVFVPATDRCASYLGMIGGQQPIRLAAKCGRGEVIHEIMHALGFVHEHSREERDRFIEVAWDHIDPNYINQFDVVPDTYVHNFTGSVFDFDYRSIMLYPPEAFAKKPGLKTLKSRTSKAIEPTQDGLSRIDIERLYYLYGY